VGPEFQAPRFLTVRIPLNKEANSQRIPRYNQWFDRPRQQNDSAINGSNDKQSDTSQRPHHPLTPVAANGDRLGASERGRDAAVRFTIDSKCAADEERQVEPYFKVEMEEYEVEV
jgi:CTD kinase subunit beta